jgi:adenylosuccinate lyase
LAPKLGKAKAHHIVYGAAAKAMDSGITLREALLAESEITDILSVSEIDGLLDPANYVGVAPAMVDAVLAKFNKRA